MTAVAPAIRLRLLELPALTALVASRVYVLIFPQPVTLPAVRVTQISGVANGHARGLTNVEIARVQVDAIAADLTTCATVMAAVHGEIVAGAVTGLQGYQGLAGDLPVAQIAPAGYRELWDADELQTVRVTRDYLVYFRPLGVAA